MAHNKQQKQEQVSALVEKLKKSQAVVITSYTGLTMNQFNTLRGTLRQSSAGYQVVKNALTTIALQQAGLAVPTDLLQGQVALGFCYDDVPAAAKALLDFRPQAEKFEVKGAVMGNLALTLKQVEALATMPPLPVIRGQLLGMLRAPASRIVGTVASGVRQVMNVVKAYSEQEATPATA